jgi:hypothetical protein
VRRQQKQGTAHRVSPKKIEIYAEDPESSLRPLRAFSLQLVCTMRATVTFAQETAD